MGSLRSVKVGTIRIGGGAPVSVQGMTSTDTRDIDATLAQIRVMAAKGADLVRVSVPDIASVQAFEVLHAQSPVPLIADCHMDPKVAVNAAKIADKLRLNPGNMPKAALREILNVAKDRGIPIRVGVNTGSAGPLSGDPNRDVRRLTDRADAYINTMVGLGFQDIVLSFKSPDPKLVILANERAARLWDFPLHLGVTQAGADQRALVAAVAGIAPLLSQGIGDTIRVSLTRDPAEQVRVGIMVLQALGLRARGPTLLACPACSRAHFDVAALVAQAQPLVDAMSDHTTVAIIGCEVNGPGEGTQADIAFYGTPSGYRVTLHGNTVFKGAFTPASERFLALLRQGISTDDQ